MSDKPIILWLRQNLRLNDNPVIAAAAKEKCPIIFLYIYDPQKHPWSIGSASKWWLHESLLALDKQINESYSGKIILRQGDPLSVLKDVLQESKANQVFWDRCYEPYSIARDKKIKENLKQEGINVQSFNTSLLHEPWEYQNKSKQHFKVFTPFWKNLQQLTIRDCVPKPKALKVLNSISGCTLQSFDLLPLKLDWHRKIAPLWSPGELGAKQHLSLFLRSAIQGYKLRRDIPSIEGTSQLSPHLHFGEISPVQIWQAIQKIEAEKPQLHNDSHHFLSEIAWREFAYHVLYYYPDLPDKPYNVLFNNFKWEKPKHLKAWQQGRTGYPIVDAGMRQLWHTGWMHNRVRMIVASFLTKHLLIPWQLGEQWFWDTLVDADLANNAASWQWVAGCGFDAAPYFRIFNPTLQGEKFDPEGLYVKHWIPELQKLDAKYIHAPWTAPETTLAKANVILGKNYPLPIVNHNVARLKALESYKNLK